MSISSAPAATASRTSASFVSSSARPDGKAVATLATCTPLPRSACTAISTRSGYTQTAATGGTLGSLGSGRIALAQSERTLPCVSAPSSVVRSTMRIAVSSAQALLVVLMLRVASPAARASAPTWSTPGRPCRKRRSDASSRVTSRSVIASPKWLLRVAINHHGPLGTDPVYSLAHRFEAAVIATCPGSAAILSSQAPIAGYLLRSRPASSATWV